MAQKSRKPKTSAGVHGGGGKLRTPMSDIQKVLLGKGIFQSRKPLIRVAPKD